MQRNKAPGEMQCSDLFSRRTCEESSGVSFFILIYPVLHRISLRFRGIFTKDKIT